MSAYFTCAPLSCRMSVSACIARRAKAIRPAGRAQAPLMSAACKDCNVGIGHAAGSLVERWETGAMVERGPAFGKAAT